MTAALDLFDSITYLYDGNSPPSGTPHVLLADDGTSHPIKGYGTITYQLCGRNVKQFCYYVPDLGSTTLISICQHSQYQGHYFLSHENSTILAFPKFIIDLANDTEISAIITKPKTNILHYDETKEILANKKLIKTAKLLPNNMVPYLPQAKRVQFAETVQYAPLHPNAKTPTRATKGSIGYDVFLSQSTILKPNSITKVHTGISMSLPSNIYCRIAPRSSLALKGVSVEGGVVDPDYTGEYIVLLRNNTNESIAVDYHQKVAQLIFKRAATPLIEVTSELNKTDRGAGGFRSTDETSQDTSSPNQPNFPSLPPKASTHHLVNRKQNWPHSQRRLTGHSEEFDPLLSQSLNQTKHKAPPTITFDDIQYISKVFPAQQPTTQSDSPSSHEIELNQHLPNSNKVATSEPQSVTISQENQAKAVGFRQIEQFIKDMPTLGNKKLHVH